jgi:ferredoxin
MKIAIQDYCIRCGLCVDLYPELFVLNYKNDVLVVKYDEIPEALQQKAKEAIRDCAIAAIRIKKQEEVL